MTTRVVEAIFEDGGFRLLTPLTDTLTDGQKVRLVVSTDDAADSILALAADVYAGLSRDEVSEVERIALRRDAFFGRDADT